MSITPCKNLCQYVEVKHRDEPMCQGCGRTYSDLDNWGYLSTAEKRKRIRVAKDNLKKQAKI